MDEPVIVFDHVFKKFARGEHHNSLRDFIPAMAKKLLHLGRRAEPTQALKPFEFWAVNDVSFKLKRGEALGIIGPNGSGKSTTLKLLSGILRPDRGTFSVRGRLSALIEVGAGFHPDLTGRENVYLNGCILGMTRKEVAAKFTQIVDFAGVEDFIDTPLKRYSSGMAVRLGFAVAAMIEPEVLLVDEVLAVGDLEFRNRCHARMDRMRKNGVTMILVSHNLNEVRNLCEDTLMLFKGQSVMQGPSQKVLEKYHETISEKLRKEQETQPVEVGDDNASTAPILLTSAQLLNPAGQPCATFATGQGMILRLNYLARQRIERPTFRVEMSWATDDFLASVYSTALDGLKLAPVEGTGSIDLRIDTLLVEPNVYLMRVMAGDGTNTYDTMPRMRFVVAEEVPIPGIFCMTHSWQVRSQSEVKETAEAAA